MAIYDLTQGIPSNIETGDILNCPYSGGKISIELPKGQYKFECWGAESQKYNIGTSGKGGYSIGSLTTKEKILFYLYTGGKPASTYAAGFNGGTATNSYGAGGGGGSDIRVATDSLYARIIVAGGGGGNGYSTTTPGGYGGGTSGGKGGNGSYAGGGGGAQTYGGTCYNSSGVGKFGEGGYMGTSGGGAGGGWYGGGHGYSGGIDSAGGGGSGYVYNSETASNYPLGCLLNSDYYLSDAQIIAGNQSFIDPDTGSSTTGRSGNGYIRITVIKISKGIEILAKRSGTWKTGILYEKQSNVWTSDLEEIPSSFTQYQFQVPTIISNLVYSGSSQTPILNNVLAKYQSLSGQTSGINAGTYNLNIGLLHENYRWIDRSKSTKILQWTIEKNPNGFILDKESGSATPTSNLVININNVSQGNITVVNNNPQYCSYSLANNQLVISYIADGNATLSISTPGNTNYLPTTKIITVQCVSVDYINLDYFTLSTGAISLTYIGGQ